MLPTCDPRPEGWLPARVMGMHGAISSVALDPGDPHPMDESVTRGPAVAMSPWRIPLPIDTRRGGGDVFT